MEVSIGFIKQDETYLLQQRPDIPTIGAAGLVGAFGGRIEPGESPVEAVCRELSEETSLKPSTDDFNYLGTLEVTAYKQHEPLEVRVNVFQIDIKPVENVKAIDGEVVRMTRPQADERINQLTPATKAAFEQFL